MFECDCGRRQPENLDPCAMCGRYFCKACLPDGFGTLCLACEDVSYEEKERE